MNPNISDKDIVNYIISFSGTELNNKIREYVAFIVNSVEMKKLLAVSDDIEIIGFNKAEYGKIIELNNTKATVFAINTCIILKN